MTLVEIRQHTIQFIKPPESNLILDTYFLNKAVGLFYRDGQFGDNWIEERVFFDAELKNTRRAHQEYQGSPDIINTIDRYLFGQYLSILQEFGFSEPFTFQQLYYFDLQRDKQDNYQVTHLSEFGEWADKFLNFDRLDGDTNKGLANAYDQIMRSKVGEVVVHISPTDYYKEAGFDSPGDVMMLFHKVIDNKGIEKIEARYVFLSELSNNKRAILLNSLGSDLNPDTATKQDVVLNSPIFKLFDKQLESNDPLRSFAEDLDKYMMTIGDNAGILQGIRGELESSLKKIIDKYIVWLRSILLNNHQPYDQKLQEYISTIRYMLVHSQIFYQRYLGKTESEILSHLYQIRNEEITLRGMGVESSLGFNNPLDNSISGVETQNKCENCGKIFVGTTRWCDKCRAGH